METTIQKYANEIKKLCESHHVNTLYAFGSVLTNKFNSNSDIDLIVDFNPIDVLEYADNYFNFKFSLQEVFKRPIDLLEQSALKNPYFIHTINKQKQLVYGC